jgi:hypothetical protein
MRYGTIACALFVGAPLLGCADLEVFHLSPGDNGPLVGAMSYYLPRSAITLSGTVTLNSCDTKADDPPDGKYHIEIAATASIAPVISTEPDPAYHYYISYEKSHSWMKEINFSVTNNANGTLQSFNTTINDQAGPIIVAAIGAAVQIEGAGMLAGLPVPPLAPHGLGELSAAIPPDYCADYLLPDVNAALIAIVKDNAEKKKITSNPAIGPAEAAAQAQAIQTIQSDIDSQTKKAKLARSFSFKWIPSLNDKHRIFRDYLLLDREINLSPLIEQWFSANGLSWLRTPPPSDSDVRKKLTSPYHVTLAILRSTMGGPGDPKIDAAYRSSEGSDGVVVRDPASATLRICRETDPGCTAFAAIQADNTFVETTNDNSSRMALRVPQFGRILVLTEKSGLFENAVLNTTLNADGTIQTIGYHSTSTLATGLSGIGQAAGNVSSAIAARNTAIGQANTAEAAVTTATTARVQAPDTFNKALADCLTQAAAILKAGGMPMSCQ